MTHTPPLPLAAPTGKGVPANPVARRPLAEPRINPARQRRAGPRRCLCARAAAGGRGRRYRERGGCRRGRAPGRVPGRLPRVRASEPGRVRPEGSEQPGLAWARGWARPGAGTGSAVPRCAERPGRAVGLPASRGRSSGPGGYRARFCSFGVLRGSRYRAEFLRFSPISISPRLRPFGGAGGGPSAPPRGAQAGGGGRRANARCWPPLGPPPAPGTPSRRHPAVR